MMIFDEVVRADSSPSAYSEPIFSYLNRSSRPEADRVRKVMEDWFREVHAVEQATLRTRLRSPRDKEHLAAFFELYLRVLCSRLGYSIESHPTVARTRRRPDFEVTTSPSARMYIEAVLALHESDRAQAATARENTVYDAVNSLHSPDFWLSLRVAGAPATPPPAKRLVRALSLWLSSLDWETLNRMYGVKDFKALPTYRFQHEGWNLVFTPIPKGDKARGKPGARPIGTKSGAFQVSRAKVAIRDAIARKAAAYGNLGEPYVVAVNSHGVHTDREDVLEALFGTANVVIDPAAKKPYIQLSPDGVWRGPHGPRNTRVSAVLVAISLHPWSVAARDPVLYINPWAKNPIKAPIDRLPRVRLVRDTPTYEAGLSVRDLLSLPEHWPENNAAA